MGAEGVVVTWRCRRRKIGFQELLRICWLQARKYLSSDPRGQQSAPHGKSVACPAFLENSQQLSCKWQTWLNRISRAVHCAVYSAVTTTCCWLTWQWKEVGARGYCIGWPGCALPDPALLFAKSAACWFQNVNNYYDRRAMTLTMRPSPATVLWNGWYDFSVTKHDR